MPGNQQLPFQLSLSQVICIGEAIQKLVKEGEKVYDEHAGELEEAEDAVLSDKTYGAQISHLKTEGERIAADIATRSITTPEEALALLQENEKFVDELTDLALRYIEDAVCSIEIPPITGEKDWGNVRRGYCLDLIALAVSLTRKVSPFRQVWQHCLLGLCRGVSLRVALHALAGRAVDLHRQHLHAAHNR